MTEDNRKYNNFRITVPSEFETVFSHFYQAENKSNESITKTLLPSYQTILVFNFGANAIFFSNQNTQITIDKCLILGPIKQAIKYTLPAHCEILVANFKDDAFYRFFGHASVAENLPIRPDDLLEENCFTSLWHELEKINDTTKRTNYILEFCKPYLKTRNPIAAQLINFIDQTLNPVKTVAIELYQSERKV
ncbi:MAG TPA: DUF6597 domain-containing transcriptional factor, partial [Arachidicoccus sp.]